MRMHAVGSMTRTGRHDAANLAKRNAREVDLSEKTFPVAESVKTHALIDQAKYAEMYARSIKDPDGFWGEHGKRIDWIKPYTKVMNVSYGPGDVSIKWYEDGTTNVAANCIDRHLKTRGDQVAIIWEGDDPAESKRITYKELHEHVCRFANVLKAKGVKKGDTVTLYLPMIPEAAYAMLACARIGAVHSIVFGGFSPDALAGAYRGLSVEGRDHGGRRPARIEDRAAQSQCRRGDRQGRRRRDDDRRQADRQQQDHHEGRSRRLVRGGGREGLTGL